MNLCKNHILATLVILACACSTAEQEQPDCPDALQDETGETVPAQAGVLFVKAAKDTDIDSLMKNIGARACVTCVNRLFPDAGKWEERHRRAGLDRWYELQFSCKEEATKAAEGLEGLRGVEHVEKAREASAIHSADYSGAFNDTQFYRQWNLLSGGGEQESGKCCINLTKAWETYSCGSEEVIVSVVDGGIDMNHEDLAGVVIPAGADGSWNFVDRNDKVSAQSHGTHVAGIIGAISNNGKGICGVAGGKDGKGGVRLLSCQILKLGEDGKDEYASNIPPAIVWGADHGAVICQNSWGYSFKSAAEAHEADEGQAIREAIDYFIKYAGLDENGQQCGPMKGGVVLFSTGNEGFPDAWPAEYSATEPRCISVGATGTAYSRAKYSNYGDEAASKHGKWVSIAAPGGEASSSGAIYSTVPGNKYGLKYGTSMACPQVSGVAALIVSEFGGPGFTNDMLVSKLLGGARYDILPADAGIGPFLDAYGALSYSGHIPPETVRDLQGEGGYTNRLDLNFSMPADADDGVAAGFLILAAKSAGILEGVKPGDTLPDGVISKNIRIDGKKAGETVRASLEGLEFETDYYVCVFAFDFGREYSGQSAMVKLRTGINHAPTIHTDYGGSYEFRAFEDVVIAFDIQDPDGHSVQIRFSSGYPRQGIVAGEKDEADGKYKVYITCPKAKAGEYTFTINVTDSYGAEGKLTQKYVILENREPYVAREIPDILLRKGSDMVSFDADDYFSDDDEEQLSYSVAVDDGRVIHAAVQGNSSVRITGLNYGLALVSITAKDAVGSTASYSFRVLYLSDKPEIISISEGGSKVSISPGSAEMEEVSVLVSSSTGKTVYKSTEKASAFHPIEISLGGYAPGLYGAVASYGGKTYSKKFTKTR